MGKLVQVATTTVSSPVSSVTLTGIDSDDVYMLTINNLSVSVDEYPELRVTKSGTPDSTANYDYAYKYLKSDAAFTNTSATNLTQAAIMSTIESSISGGNGNGIYYLFNFSNASEYSFVTVEETHLQQNVNVVYGFQGGFVHTVASASDGVYIFLNAGNNITSGTFTLYKVL